MVRNQERNRKVLSKLMDESDSSRSSRQQSSQQNSSRRSQSASPPRRGRKAETSQHHSLSPRRQGRSQNQSVARATTNNPRNKNVSAPPPVAPIRPPNTGSNRRKQKPPYALNEIRRLQNETGNLIPKLPFSRVVKEVLHVNLRSNFRVTRECMEVIQSAAECYLIQMLEDSYKLTLHRNRVTLAPSDIMLLLYLRGVTDPGNK